MARVEFTPGPWEASGHSIYGTEIKPVHDGKTCLEVGLPPSECGPAVLVGLSESLIRDIKDGDWDDFKDAEVNLKDLALIAAAPDLLEALMDANHLIQCLHGVNMQIRDDSQKLRDLAECRLEAIRIKTKLRAAIAKATGETP